MCAGTWEAVKFLDMCVILCIVFSTGAAQQRQVEAQVGHSVNMQCVAPVPTITQWKTLRLFLQKRVPLSNPKVVFSFSNDQAQPGHQDRAYQNRCHLFKDNLTLSLSQVSISDKGEYDCKIFLLKPRGYELEYTGNLFLSVWANYSTPQVLFSSNSGTVHTAVCSSNGGYPRGYVEWNISSDIGNMTETRADSNPQTQLYNVSGCMTLPLSATGSICCCVVAASRRVCSDITGIPQPRISAAGRGGTRANTAIICLSIMMSLTLCMLQQAGVHVYTGGTG
ncbi:hypothetical protein PRIEUP_LOCUS12120 [Pristimantis euphronides]